MQILKFPHPKLLTKCEKVTSFDDDLRKLLDEMWDTMKAAGGVGLAANQVGLSHRMFVMELDNGRRINLINPYITARSVGCSDLKEGCLSAPEEFLNLNRADWIQVTFEDHYGEVHAAVFDGLQAVCVQHEVDHLDGKVFMIDSSVPRKKRIELSKKWGLK